MGFVNDAIIKKYIEIMETVSTDYNSPVIEIDRAESGTAFFIKLSNGNGAVNMEITLALSVDGVNFTPVADFTNTITDDDNEILLDLLDTQATFARVEITVTTGAIDFEYIQVTAKRRH